MSMQESILSQYLAALAMLRQAIQRCPDALWDDARDRTRFWQVAYHALFYLHLYVQDTEQDFRPWSRHRPEAQNIGAPSAGHAPTAPAEPYDRAGLLEYCQVCAEEIQRCVPGLDLAAGSGFYWLPFNKLELQLYNLRHLQLHTGELAERLGARAGVDVDWVGRPQP